LLREGTAPSTPNALITADRAKLLALFPGNMKKLRKTKSDFSNHTGEVHIL
jgi:hypothetical protein